MYIHNETENVYYDTQQMKPIIKSHDSLQFSYMYVIVVSSLPYRGTEYLCHTIFYTNRYNNKELYEERVFGTSQHLDRRVVGENDLLGDNGIISSHRKPTLRQLSLE